MTSLCQGASEPLVKDGGYIPLEREAAAVGHVGHAVGM
jgi:hypothetical protein